MSGDSDARLRAALRKLLRARHARFLDEFSHAVRGAAIERVHQSRVVARGLRSIIGTLDEAVEPRLAASILRDLRATGLELGSMREADVRRRWLTTLAAETGLDPALAKNLKHSLDRDCLSARRAFREYAHSSACRERADRLASAFADRRLVASRSDLEDLLVRRLRRRWRRLLDALDIDGSDALAMHEVRLRAKHARYATEALLPLLGADPASAVKPLRRLQSCLGDHHDAFDALTWLGMRARSPGPDLLARLRGPIRRRMRERLEDFRAARRQLAVPKVLRPAR